MYWLNCWWMTNCHKGMIQTHSHMANWCDEQNITKINLFFHSSMDYGLKRKGVIGKEKGTTHEKWGNWHLLVITLLCFNLIVIRHTLVWYVQNYCWMSWSLFTAVKTTPDFYSVLCFYSCDTQQVPFRYQTGKKVNKIQAWSLHSVKPSAMGFTRIGLTLRLTFHRPLFQ
jgi:hypothetical protein